MLGNEVILLSHLKTYWARCFSPLKKISTFISPGVINNKIWTSLTQSIGFLCNIYSALPLVIANLHNYTWVHMSCGHPRAFFSLPHLFHCGCHVLTCLCCLLSSFINSFRSPNNLLCYPCIALKPKYRAFYFKKVLCVLISLSEEAAFLSFSFFFLGGWRIF